MKIIETGIVYENPKPYLRSQHAFHPTLVDLGGGELLCGYDLGEAVESMDYRTYRSRSTDGGRTWTPEGAIIQGRTRRPSVSSVRLSKVATGLVGFGFRGWRDDPNEGVVNRANLGYVPMELILVRSRDSGHTWSRPTVIRPSLEGPAFETCHGIVELPSGRWLAPTSTWRGWNGELPSGHKTVVLISDDRGRTWARHGVAFDGDAEDLRHWEVSVVPLGGETVLAVAWVYHEASGRHRPNRFALSRDGGQTFGPAREIGIQGQTCKGLALRDGRVMLAYRRTDEPGLWATMGRVEVDPGRWSLMETLPLWGASLRSSGMTGEKNRSDELSGLKFGFPQMRQLESGEVLLVFWCFEDWCTKIRWMRIGV
jgi:sialidase-1